MTSFFSLFRRDERPAHVIDAERHPKNYFTCDGCGDGPWHWTRADWCEDANDPTKRIRLGACCSGAD